jgi:hypothetical protein
MEYQGDRRRTARGETTRDKKSRAAFVRRALESDLLADVLPLSNEDFARWLLACDCATLYPKAGSDDERVTLEPAQLRAYVDDRIPWTDDPGSRDLITEKEHRRRVDREVKEVKAVYLRVWEDLQANYKATGQGLAVVPESWQVSPTPAARVRGSRGLIGYAEALRIADRFARSRGISYASLTERRPGVRNDARAVLAAVLHDEYGASYAVIGEVLSPPKVIDGKSVPQAPRKPQAVEEIVRRGRRLLDAEAARQLAEDQTHGTNDVWIENVGWQSEHPELSNEQWENEQRKREEHNGD